jgi:hypothetical protein
MEPEKAISGKIKYLLQQLKRMWLLFAKTLVKINTFILLSLVYIIIVGFIALILRILRIDLLQKKMNSNRTSYWRIRASSEPTLDRQKYQF